MIGIGVNMIEVIEETLRMETGPMTEVEAGIKITEEDFGSNNRDSGSRNRDRSNSRNKSKEEGVITVENKDIFKGIVKKTKGIKVNKEIKSMNEAVADVAAERKLIRFLTRYNVTGRRR